MAKQQNAFLAKLQAQANAKAATKTEAHVEIDTMAWLLAVHEVLQVGPDGWAKYRTMFPFLRDYW